MLVFLVTGAVACVSSCCFSLEEITAGWVAEWKNKPFAELEVELYKRSFDVKKHSCFKSKTLTKAVKEKIEDLNQNGFAKPQWCHDHLDNGYFGFNYQYTEGEPVLNYQDITRMWGLAKFLVVTRLHESKL